MMIAPFETEMKLGGIVIRLAVESSWKGEGGSLIVKGVR
jgi:hypothetical protein